MKNSDRRAKYTKMVLRSSLLELLKEKPVNRITVTELCEHADINRGTFYLHYYDVYDLLDKIEKELFDTIKQSLKTTLKIATLPEFMTEVVAVVVENSDLCKILFFGNDSSGLIKQILDLAKELCIDDIRKRKSGTEEWEIDYTYSFSANGSVTIIREWIESGFKEPLQKIADLIVRLNSAVLF